MPKYIAMLRGINVSGKNIIRMEDLRALYEGLGYKNVATYIQSGNVVFESKKKTFAVFQNEQSAQIKTIFGYDVPVTVIDKSIIDQAIDDNPFLKQGATDIAKLHITFLSQEPEAANVQKISKEAYLPDEWDLIGKFVYLHCPAGYGHSKLINSFFEQKLKVQATTRNWKTIQELARMAAV